MAASDMATIEWKIRLAYDRLQASHMAMVDWTPHDRVDYEYRKRDYDQSLGRYQGLIDLAEHIGLRPSGQDND